MQATKEIGRELKRVKAFMLQRLVKRCRKLRGGNDKAPKGKGAGNESRWVQRSDGMGLNRIWWFDYDYADSSSRACMHDSGGEQEAQKEDSPAVLACLAEIKAVKVRHILHIWLIDGLATV